ncbi:retroviral-like aspartic protease family protein [Rhizomicrobium electricum]|uniref:Peptidase A2 domain-containing protein n=1 Tax=Rhizomicrobium electricum TaxID=480070 RepID=A0ABP3PM24_9PROT|nr:retroviral-like aspartic protease family protein [Rhizomicrobium electricum]NIJ46864.1 clan AA aspartic protease (TIGR02281 family) [Rhizomicrobium electricum]
MLKRTAGCLALAMMATVAAVAADPAPSAVPPSVCKLHLYAALDMEMDNTGRITVPIALNGTPQRIMLDTGAAQTMIAHQTVEALGLKTKAAPYGAGMKRFGGRFDDQQVTISEFAIGEMKGRDVPLFVRSDDFDSAGLLGTDVLRNFDLELDFANASLKLIAPNDCEYKTYWTSSHYGVVPFVVGRNHIVVKMKLDGEDINAILDTGAADSVMSLERAAKVFDLDKKALDRSRHYPFKTLSFGDVSVSNPAIELVPGREAAVLGGGRWDRNMIVGMGVLRRLHLYIDFKHQLLYVTPATQY